MSHIYAKFKKHIKTSLAALTLAVGAQSAHAQSILFVNDNDYITANTDTLLSDLNHSIYSSYHYWNAIDSGTGPSAAYMDNYDMVIWYASTDGVGLNFWGTTGSTGNAEIINFAGSGKPLWVIGQDLLYQAYPTTPATFATGDFAHDIMGLTSYDVQSYANDGSTGCPEADRIGIVPSIFPSTLKWIFATNWYMDGCTPQSTTIPIYQMGPSSYTLTGKQTMFHHRVTGVSVMSTFFDPALIDTFTNRVDFMEKSITYLWGATTGVGNLSKSNVSSLYPNPATAAFSIDLHADKNTEVAIALLDVSGRVVMTTKDVLSAGNNTLHASVSGLDAGFYTVKVTDVSGAVLYVGKVSKQ